MRIKKTTVQITLLVFVRNNICDKSCVSASDYLDCSVRL